MRLNRFFCNADFIVGMEMALDADVSKHLVTVLRLPVGAEVTLFNGRGAQARAEIIKIGKISTLKIMSVLFDNKLGKLKIHLLQACINPQKFELILQKATELGVDSITPIITEYVNLKRDFISDKLSRLHKIIISACEQCGRNELLILKPAINLRAWQGNADYGKLLVLDPKASDSIRDYILTSQKDDKLQAITILIGPEGGFADAEIRWLEDKGFVRLHFGPYILRAETAAISVVAVLRAMCL